MEKEDAIIVPLKSMSLPEIQESAEFWINDALEVHSASDIWILLKQVEAYVDAAKAYCKESAFESIGNQLGGLAGGELMGHGVRLSYPSRWDYSPAVKALADQQKLDMAALKATEEANGLAVKGQKTPTITITLRK